MSGCGQRRQQPEERASCMVILRAASDNSSLRTHASWWSFLTFSSYRHGLRSCGGGTAGSDITSPCGPSVHIQVCSHGTCQTGEHTTVAKLMSCKTDITPHIRYFCHSVYPTLMRFVMTSDHVNTLAKVKVVKARSYVYCILLQSRKSVLLWCLHPPSALADFLIASSFLWSTLVWCAAVKRARSRVRGSNAARSSRCSRRRTMKTRSTTPTLWRQRWCRRDASHAAR